MAHNIYENRMFCVGKAWHDVGIRINEEVTSEEAIKLSGLDYEVIKVPLFAEQNNQKIDAEVFGTLNTSNNKILGVVADRYKIVQNIKAFEFFDGIVKSKEAFYHSAGALGNGEKIWILAKLPKNLLVFRNDVVEKYLLFTNSHDGKSAVKMYFTPIRVVCQNTLIASYKDQNEGISINHVGNINAKTEEAKRLLGLALDFYKDFEIITQKFVNTSMTRQGFDQYAFRILNITENTEKSTNLENNIDRLSSLFINGKGNNEEGIKNTLWAGYNAFTEFADHYKTTRGNNRVNSILFGSGATMKRKAYEEALKLI